MRSPSCACLRRGHHGVLSCLQSNRRGYPGASTLVAGAYVHISGLAVASHRRGRVALGTFSVRLSWGTMAQAVGVFLCSSDAIERRGAYGRHDLHGTGDAGCLFIAAPVRGGGMYASGNAAGWEGRGGMRVRQDSTSRATGGDSQPADADGAWEAGVGAAAAHAPRSLAGALGGRNYSRRV